MQIELPDSLTGNMQKDDVLLDLAVGMYAARHLTLGQAAGLSNISQGDFQSELGRRQIAVQYDLEDLAYDLRAASELAR
jgi:predicted HTH domain antitoxin